MHSNTDIVSKVELINRVISIGNNTENYQNNFNINIDGKIISSYCSLRLLSRSMTFLLKYNNFCISTDMSRYVLDKNGNYIIKIYDKLNISKNPINDFTKFHQLYYFALSMHHGLMQNQSEYEKLDKYNKVVLTNSIKIFSFNILQYAVNCCKFYNISAPWIVDKCKCLEKIIKYWNVDAEEVDTAKLNEKYMQMQNVMKENYKQIDDIFNNLSKDNLTNINKVANVEHINTMDKIISTMNNTNDVDPLTKNTIQNMISNPMTPTNTNDIAKFGNTNVSNIINADKTVPKSLNFNDFISNNTTN